MTDNFRTRARNFLGLDPLKGRPTPEERSAYARFTAPGPDTSRNQLLVGALIYVVMTVFCIALVFGSTGMFGRIAFGVLGILGFLFAMQRFVLLTNRGDDDDDDEMDTTTPVRDRPAASRRTGGAAASSKGRGARRSGDPRRSG